jgi:hypothetical protein
LLEINKDKINWINLCLINLNANKILINNKDKIKWNILAHNYGAIELLKENPDKIDWYNLSFNKNAIELIKKNLHKINYLNLLINPNIIELFEEKYITYINYHYISCNPSIFTYDYELIKTNFKTLGEEIIIKSLHPNRMLKLMELYGEEDIYKSYFDEE